MNRIHAIAIAALTTFFTGCAHSVPVQYIEAAELDIQQDVRTILVIDRSRSRGAQHIVDGIEGAATGETYLLDADSAALALETLEVVLEEGQRFEVVNFQVNGRDVDTSRWDRAMAARQVRQLCRRAKCDAVVALEHFDSDTFTEIKDTGERIDVTQETDVAATFRLYDGSSGDILDQQAMIVGDTHTGSDDTAEEALDELPHGEAVYDGAAQLGASYASRISPHVVVDHRTIYGSGSPGMKRARKAARRGDLGTAVSHWETVASLPGDPILKAKALYNLAISAEANGDLLAASDYARQASLVGGKGRMATYVRILELRLQNETRVAKQMGHTQHLAQQ